jgi:hypothetical protein
MLQLNLPPVSADLKAEFAADLKINLSDIWTAESAEHILHCLQRETPYDNAFFANGRYQSLLDQELRQMSAEQVRQWMAQLHQLAAEGTGFLYGSHLIGRPQRQMQTPPLLSQVHQLLNSPAMLQFMRALTGEQELIYASAQASRYVPGNYLTRHNDVVEAEGRRFAYVMGFTRQWHPDWGGLLQFFTATGTPTQTWVPRFNNMAIFEVHHPHAVTYVTPFARQVRYSVTGWFRTKGPQ